MYIKNSSGWKQISEMYIKIASGWKQISEAYIKTATGWKRFWSGGTLSPQNPITISQSTNATTYLITLTGTNYYWSPGPPGLTYYFEWSTNGGTSWTTLSTASAVNPAYGSSTSYTHQITTAQLSANLVNTYRFRIAATYGSQSASSSATTTVQGPTNITLTAGDTGVSSIPINWTSSTGGYRYLVEYKTNTSSTWSTFSWTGTTYETITGLAEGTLYNVRVTPYTSQSNNSTYKAYAGNASNIVNATTKVTPGNLSRVENYNFSGSTQQGFFTTGSNTTKVNYYFNCISIPSLSVPTYSQNTTSGIPYKIQQNLLSYFTIKTWNYDTYSPSPSSTYYSGNTVWYAGNQYTAKLIGFSGVTPPNTTYWTFNQTVANPWSSTTSYSVGNKVWLNGTVYICITANTNQSPTGVNGYIYWSFDQSLPNTYNASTTYYLGNSVWLNGSQYTAKDQGFSGQVPTNTAYWTLTTTVTYNIGDYVSYNSNYYFCKTSTNGTYPTNTTYWVANSLSFQMYATPYNVDIPGTTSSAASTLIIRADQASTDPLQISSGPTFSNITATAFRTTFTPSVYTNQVDFYIQKVLDSSYPTGYNPKVINVSGATSTNHDTTVALSPASQYLVTINSRYMYDSTYSVFHNGLGSPGYVTTAAPLPDPPTNLSVTDVGTNRPYSNAAYNLSWTAPTYTGGVTLSGYKIQFQIPSVGTTWYDYSANTVDTTSTSTTVVGFGSNLSTNFRVYSVNSAGQSATAVATSSPVLGTTVPQAPTIGTATTYNGYATVTYTANATGGKSISSFTATSNTGGYTGSASSGSIFVYSLGHNTQYSFSVTATNANGTSSSSSLSNTIYGVNIGSVTVNSYTATATTITLNFTKATNSTSTRGYLSGSLDGTTTGTSYTFSGLVAGNSYSLGLAGTATVNGTLYIGPINSNSYSTSSPPSIPSGVSATTTRTDGVNISWTASTGSPTSYEIYWNIVGGAAPSDGSPADFTGITTTSYLDTSLAAGSSRDYWVRSRNAAGASSWSVRVTGTRASSNVAPTITNPTISPSSGTAGSTTYTASATVSGTPTPTVTYQWQYLNTSFVYTNVPGATSSSYLPPSSFNTTYPNYGFYCLITATNAAGTATSRPTATLNSPAAGSAPATPTNVSTSTSGLVTWTASSGATSYTVEYYLASSGAGANAYGPLYSSPNPTGTSYQIAYQTVGTNYLNYARARVRANNANGSSAYSGFSPTTGYA